MQGDLRIDPTRANDDLCASLSTSDVVVSDDSLFSALSLVLLLVTAADRVDIDILANPLSGEADLLVQAARRAITMINGADIIAVFISTFTVMLDHDAGPRRTGHKENWLRTSESARPGNGNKKQSRDSSQTDKVTTLVLLSTRRPYYPFAAMTADESVPLLKPQRPQTTSLILWDSC